MRSSLPVLSVTLLALVATLAGPALAAPPAGAGPATGAPAPLAASGPAPVAAPGAPAAHPASGTSCPTPQNLPDWTGPNFFNDSLVTFTVPGHPEDSGANFQTVPCLNSLPTYLPGFYMNVSTNVPLEQAYVSIWGTVWPTPNQPLADLPGFPFDGTQVTEMPMLVTPGAPDQASFWFDTQRFFYPGATVYFNVTLKSSVGTPGTINSAQELSQIAPAPANLNATWKFELDAPWWSPDFSHNIRLSSSPPVLGRGVFAPNENQSFDVGIESVGANGLPGTPIPEAELTFTISNDPGFNGTYGVAFAPLNHTFENLSSVIGPYPNATVRLNVSAWLPWEGGAIDKIASGYYWFNWSKKGGWPTPALGLAANALLATDPSVLAASPTPLPSGTPVNVSLTEPEPNVTVNSAIIRFHFSDADGSASGVVPMHRVGQNVTYAVLPGFPSGSRLTFSVLAKDVFGDPLASGNYTYVEAGPPTTTPSPFSSYFYVEGINATTGTLLAGVPFTVSNASWSQSGTTTAFGFGLLQIPNGAGTLDLPYGTYTVTMSALAHAQTAHVSLGSPTPVVVRFWFANGAVSANSVVPLDPISVALIVGVLALTGAFYPLYRYFQERQRRAEQERTRVTL
jgi:hypothetical protein